MFIASCKAQSVPKRIQNNFTNCYSLTKTDILNHLDIDGYYVIRQNDENVAKEEQSKSFDTTEFYMLFYEDGAVLFNVYEPNVGYGSDIQRYLKRLYVNGTTDSFDNWYYWGVYKINGDTLVTQVIKNKSFLSLSPWEAWERKYLIRDRKTLQYLGKRDLEHQKSKQLILFGTFLPVVFVSYPFIPPHNSWLKKQSWTQCK